MPKLTQQAKPIITATHEVKLAPALRTKLEKRLRLYADLKAKLDAAQDVLNREKRVLDGLREQTGEQSLVLEGHGTLTEVRGVSKKLDKKKLVQLGCALAWIEEATTSKPKKPYLLVTLPGEEKGEDDDD